MAAVMVAANRMPPRNVVLVGAGHAHVEVLRSFAERRPQEANLTLVTRSRNTPYSGMLPGLISGIYRFDETQIDTQPLAMAAGARFLQAEAVGLDLGSRRLHCLDVPPVPYDLISFDIGSTPNTGGVPGASEHAIPVKPIDGFLERFEALRRRARERSCSRIVLVGGGAAGIELVLSVERRLRTDAGAVSGRDGLKFVVVCASAEILPNFPERFRRKFRRILESRGIEIVENARVTGVAPGEVHVQGLPTLPADEVLWVTEAAAPKWLRATGLALDGSGFIEVDETLRVRGQDRVFSVGDVAAFSPNNLPKSGVYAVRQGPILSDNILRHLSGRRLRTYSPQREALCLVSTGGRHAIGTRNGLVMEGAWAWRFKDWLDRRWISRYQMKASVGSGQTLPQ
jgi:selenide,water dikinase